MPQIELELWALAWEDPGCPQSDCLVQSPQILKDGFHRVRILKIDWNLPADRIPNLVMEV